MASDFSLRTEQLKDLQVYQTRIAQASAKIQTGCDALSAEFRCTAVVLGVLALLAAGGSAALIVMSHGPYVHLSYFVSGVVLGGASIGFLVWMANAYAYSLGQKEALYDSLQLQVNEPVTIQDLLNVMTQAQTPGINKVLQDLDSTTRGHFIAGTCEQFFGDIDPQPLTSEQKKVVSAFTSIEQELISEIHGNNALFAKNLRKNIDPASLTDGIIVAFIEKIGAPTNEEEANWLLSHFNLLGEKDKVRGFAILEHASPNPDPFKMRFIMSNPSSEGEAKSLLRHPETLIKILNVDDNERDFAVELLRYAPEGQEPAILDNLFRKVGKPNVQEAQILARHPEALLRFMNSSKDDGLIAGYPELVVGLAIEHPLIFSPQIIARIYKPQTNRAQKTQVLALMADARDQKDQTPEIQRIIVEAVQSLIADLIKEVIASEDPSNGTLDYMNLLDAIGRWPFQAAQSIFTEGFTQDSTLSKEMSALTVLYTHMQPNEKVLFKNGAVSILTSRKDAVNIYPKLITSAQANTDLKVPLFEIMAQTPLLMADAMHHIEEMQGNEIVLMMTGSQKDIYRQQYMKIFKDKNNATIVIASLTEELLKTTHEKLSSSYALAYFKNFPKELKVLVIENEKLGTELKRGRLALTLLELIEEKAEEAIEDLDNDLSAGYPYYNYLINQLLKEAHTSEITESRARLMARFELGEDDGKKIIDLTRVNTPIRSTYFFSLFGGEERILFPLDHLGWANFIGAANSQMKNVYKRKS